MGTRHRWRIHREAGHSVYAAKSDVEVGSGAGSSKFNLSLSNALLKTKF